MNKKNNLTKLINILADGNIYSANHLSDILNININYISEYIKLINIYGIEINKYYNKFYQIKNNTNLLNYKEMHNVIKNSKIIFKPIINSTNQYMLDSIEQLNIGDVCIAECQTSGRGKYGCHWISPFGCNLYLSLYWYSKQILNNNPLELTLMTSTVIAETLNKIYDSNIKIKWPNDLYLNKKKLAGILIETKTNFKKAIHIIIGIGINIAMDNKYSSKITQNWINLETLRKNINRNFLATEIIFALKNELPIFEKYGFYPFIDRLIKLNKNLYQNITKLNIKN